MEYRYKDFSGYASTDELPYRFSRAQDMWGYYNGDTSNVYSLMPTLYIYPQMFNDSRKIGVYKRNNYTGPEYVLAGANRQPSAEVMDVGLLTKITYPTGGFTKFEYEPHQFRDLNEEFIGGGLRIKKITKYDGIPNTLPITYNYAYTDSAGYSSGRVISMPQYAIPRGLGTTYTLDGSELSYRANTIRYSVSQAPMGTTQGSNVGYRKVTESMSGNGKTEFQFSLPATWFDANDAVAPSPGADCTVSENGICGDLYRATPIITLAPRTPLRYEDFNFTLFPGSINSFPFPENTNYDWARGLLLKKKTFNESGQLLQFEDFTYSNWIANGMSSPTKVFGLKLEMITAARNPSNSSPSSSTKACIWRGGRYYYLSDIQKVLTSKTTTEYEPSSNSSTTKVEQFKYEGTSHPNVTQVTETTSSGDELIKKIKYSADYNTSTGAGGAQGISALKYKEITGVPIETTLFVKRDGTEYLKEASVLSYDNLSNNIPVAKREFKIENDQVLSNFAPSFTIGTIWTFVKDARYVEQSVINRFDDKGNPLEVVYKGGENVCYIWGYNKKYPIAKIVNATYTQIEGILSMGILENLNNGYRMVGTTQVNLTDAEIRSGIDALRAALPSSLITTYTYKPLVGMTSETAPNGAITYYEYDCFNRLLQVKDQSGNLLKTYDYQYQQN